jgi:toxin ParE1/3/4
VGLKPLPVQWSWQALATLEGGLDYIAQFNPEAARTLKAAILEGIERIRRFPRSGRVVPEEADAAVREFLREPFRVIYQVHSGAIRILAVRRMEQGPWPGGDRQG